MAYTFEQAKKRFRDDDIRELSQDADGLRFLKLPSLSRREHMERLAEDCGLTHPGLRGDSLLRFLYDSKITVEQIEQTINAIYLEERSQRREGEDELISELYRIQLFDWGGLHQNSLEKTIVDNYVKKIKSYNRLCDCIENELHESMRGYVLCSWYNHWTSRIIEDVFRDHDAILPAVGLIKKIDFFFNDVPFDLKVTYMPEGFIEEKRRGDRLRPEITLLKSFCRDHSIHFGSGLRGARLREDLWAKVSDHPSESASQLIADMKNKRMEYLRSALTDPVELIKWLYENQGVRRFDASNRLFLVLVDGDNFFDSWKLKRAKPLLVESIHSHLGRAPDTPGFVVSFEWDGSEYVVRSDIIFVIHSRE
ncbi:MAG TPA: hypothetical protein VMW16_07755 [Sedimentisphaerales bacterium]|nr:hypothetical protein [Sedimentisphaerales bacterium]